MMRRHDRAVTGLRDIEGILLGCKTCHLAMIDEGTPYVVPLSFGYTITDSEELELYFHSSPEGKKLDVLHQNNKVCFDISCEGELIRSENPCGYGYRYASVIGFGEAFFVDDIEEKCRALSAIFKQQAQKDVLFSAEQARGVCVFKIVSTDYVGKQKSA